MKKHILANYHKSNKPMKTKIEITILTMFLSLTVFYSFSQEDKESFTIENVDEIASYEAIYETFKKYKLPRPSINKNTHSGLTGYITYNNLLFKNRFKYGISFEEGALSVFITEKEYLSDEGWVQNLLPMSKKRVEKQLDPIEEHLRKLLADKPFVVGTKAGEEAGDKRIGISDNLAFMRTGDTTLEVIALVKGTEIVAFDLSDDAKKVKKFVYMAAPDSAAFVLSFDDDGKPTSAAFPGYYMDIYNLTEDRMNIGLYDSLNNFIGAETVVIPGKNRAPDLSNQAGKGGPNGLKIAFTDKNLAPYNVDVEDLTQVLDNVLYVVDGVSCIALMPTGVGAVVPCLSFATKSMKMFLPKESFTFKQLTNIENCLSLIPFKNPLKTIEAIGNVASTMKNAIELHQNNTPKVEHNISVIGGSKIKLGAFAEESQEVILHARSTLNKPIKYHASSDVLHIQKISESHPRFREGFLNLSVQAMTNTKFDHESVIFYHPVDSDSYPTYTKKLIIESPKYYYMPSCESLLNDGIIDNEQYDKCLDESDACFEMIDDRGDVVLENDPEMLSAIINEHILSASPITDPDSKLNSEKLNIVRKLWKSDGTPYPADELGELREFVKKAPCTASWYGLGDKKDLITLGKEGLSKINLLNEKIETLKANLTQENWEANKAKAEKIEVQMDTIKAQYARKMNEIAAKRTISWPTTVSAKEKFIKPAETIEVYGVQWLGNQPRILYEMPFTPIRKKKRVTYYEGYSRLFWLNVSSFVISFEDGTNKPLKHGFTRNGDRSEFEKGVISSHVRFDDFLKDITVVDVIKTNAKGTEIK
jgi:hypothetical protein